MHSTYIPLLKADDVEYLLEKILPNSQLIDCAYIMEEVLKLHLISFQRHCLLGISLLNKKDDVGKYEYS
jgi:hypothetical protein